MHDLLAHVAIAVVGALIALPLARSSSGVWVALVALIASTTVARERIGIPFELDALTVPMLATVLFLRERARVFAWPFYPALVAASAYVAANVAATLLNPPFAAMAVRQCMILGVRAATLYLVLVAVVATSERRFDIPRVLFALVFVQVAASYAAYLLYPTVDTPLVWFELHGPGALSLGGFFQEPNLLGAFLATTMVMGLAHLASGAGSLSSGRTIALISAAMPALVLTYTRGAWLGAMAGVGAVVALCYLHDRTRLRAAIAFSSAFVALFAVSLGLGLLLTGHGLLEGSSAVGRRLAEFVDAGSPSALGRLAIWTEAFDQWRLRPVLGFGPLSSDAGDGTGWLYGSVIQTLHDTGIVGLIGMLALLGLVAARTWRAYATATDPSDRAILLGYLVVQGVLFLTSQLSSFFWGAYSWVFMGLALGHVAAIEARARSTATTRDPVTSRATTSRRPDSPAAARPTG
jgi:O-antigen ligase